MRRGWIWIVPGVIVLVIAGVSFLFSGFQLRP